MPISYAQRRKQKAMNYYELRDFQTMHPEYFEMTPQRVKSGENAGQMGMGMTWKPRYKGRRAGPSWEKLSLMRRRIRMGGG